MVGACNGLFYLIQDNQGPREVHLATDDLEEQDQSSILTLVIQGLTFQVLAHLTMLDLLR